MTCDRRIAVKGKEKARPAIMYGLETMAQKKAGGGAGGVKVFIGSDQNGHGLVIQFIRWTA